MSAASLSFRGIAPLKRGDRSCIEVTWRSELHGAGHIVVLETTHRWATLHASNVVRWLEAR